MKGKGLADDDGEAFSFRIALVTADCTLVDVNESDSAVF